MLDIREIMERIPQRPPFLLVDRVTELSANAINGYKNVTMNEPHFRGHFPGNPLMPGVLQLEALVQLSWLLYVGNEHRSTKPQKIDLCKVRKLKFRQPVRPGDCLQLNVTETESGDGFVTVLAKSQVEGNTTCEGLLTFKLW